jgi:undecaprenyl phosphate-alpha-L-ara4FN deformylase
VTLPTYDEIVGRNGMTAAGCYRHVASRLDREGLNVLAIHAEVEGLARLAEYTDFVDALSARGWRFVPLGSLVAEVDHPPAGRIERGEIAGREGWVSHQVPVEAR